MIPQSAVSPYEKKKHTLGPATRLKEGTQCRKYSFHPTGEWGRSWKQYTDWYVFFCYCQVIILMLYHTIKSVCMYQGGNCDKLMIEDPILLLFMELIRRMEDWQSLIIKHYPTYCISCDVYLRPAKLFQSCSPLSQTYDPWSMTSIVIGLEILVIIQKCVSLIKCWVPLHEFWMILDNSL